ncbi:Nitrogen assimilation transcription factor nit-4 [Colletotrichum sp. SAR 10_70]|nr:Nitrogen assimilation transcription factor nit-4 [Colletotrichum sp. SAR 10_71]KAI8196042.1 Nitrogen assimilation transcription factor nit-4 [Colletotrichum sp. SAR 10_70]
MGRGPLRKYWDEDYVRALEAQVQSLLLALEKQQDGSEKETSPPVSLSEQILPESDALHEGLDDAEAAELAEAVPTKGPTVEFRGDLNDTPSTGKDAQSQERSQRAMEELCVMLWRTNVGDGVTIINDPTTGSKYALEAAQEAPPSAQFVPPENVLAYCRQPGLIHEMADTFLQNINKEHQFTQYTNIDFLQRYPYQAPDEAFLHSAIIATGTTFSLRPDAMKIGDTFGQFAESLAFTCCRLAPTVKVIQGLSMMSWRSLALGRDHFGWIFISMAADALNAFFRSRDNRLHLTGDSTPKPVILFHLAYQMTILITMPPFLRIFATISQASSSSSTATGGQNSEFMLLVLRSLTGAATATSRLVRTYRRAHGFETPPNPVIIHHLLSAAIVHLMNATSWTPALRHQSTYWLRQCLELLRELQIAWPVRAVKSITVIRVLAQRWGVMRALPIEFSYQIEPTAPGAERDYSAAPTLNRSTSDSSTAAANQVGLEYEWDRYGAAPSEAPVDFGTLDMNSFASLGTLDVSGLGVDRTNPVGSVDIFQAFQGLANCEDFNWLSGNSM